MGADTRTRGRAFTRITVTIVMGLIAALAFVFSFGNVWSLALRLGIPRPIAPLIAPMVDLSVVGLLVALRYLSLQGVDKAELRPATRLMHLCSLLTVALNTADPLILQHWGRAALDTVAPLLLLGWGAVGPALLRHLHTPLTPPVVLPVQEDTLPEETKPASAAAPVADRPQESGPQPAAASAASVPPSLLGIARRIAQQHHAQHGSPITPDQLRIRLGVAPALAHSVHAQLATA